MGQEPDLRQCTYHRVVDVPISSISLVDPPNALRLDVSLRFRVEYEYRSGCDLPIGVRDDFATTTANHVIHARIQQGSVGCGPLVGATEIFQTSLWSGAFTAPVHGTIRDGHPEGTASLAFDLSAAVGSSATEDRVEGAPCDRNDQCPWPMRCIPQAPGLSVCATSCSNDGGCADLKRRCQVSGIVPYTCSLYPLACAGCDPPCPSGYNCLGCVCLPDLRQFGTRCRCDEDCPSGRLCGDGTCDAPCVSGRCYSYGPHYDCLDGLCHPHRFE
jgi:hypothetical protein